MELSQDQNNALSKLIDWYKDSLKEPFITLGGYAGTGKTTLMGVLRESLNELDKSVKVAFCSYTGKASRVLNNKLIEANTIYKGDSISTIHSLIYSPIENDKGVIIGWERKTDVDADLIIIDEASMVNEEIWQDLLSYELPIIAVGDHGQLPPVKSTFNLMKKPLIKLEEIHRQEKDNPIIKVATYARMFGNIPAKSYSDTVVKHSKTDPWVKDTIMDLLGSYNNESLILTGFNKTRVRINQYIRSALEYYSPTPSVGDRVICLRNNREKGVFNGMLGNIIEISREDDMWFNAEILMDDDLVYEGLISADQFNNSEPFNFTDKRQKYLGGDLFDFGYALTVHKAQGSEAKRVIVFEERSQHMDSDMWRRWLYTAVTRAREELYIVG
jgi:exodeoxyribonuclease V